MNEEIYNEPVRKCCKHSPDILSWWRDKKQHWALRCCICGLETRIDAWSRQEAIGLWEQEEVC